MQNCLQEKIQLLAHVCRQLSASNVFAMWIVDAIAWYVNTGRATLEFEKAVALLSEPEMAQLCQKCLRGSLSDDGIIKSVKRSFKQRGYRDV